MDPYLKQLCMEILNEDVNSERFAMLLVETGVRLESLEWDMANKILEKGDEVNCFLKRNSSTVH